MVSLYVCSKVSSPTSKEITKLELNENNPNLLTVGNLLTEIKEKLNLKPESEDYQLICFGRKLKEDKLLSHYGIKSNAVVHLFLRNSDDKRTDRKNEDKAGKGKKAKFDQSEIHNMVVASRMALMNASFRKILKRLHENDFRNNLIQCTPGLKDDPIAIAVLHDPELLSMMTDSDVINKVMEKHPAILEAATYLATAFHEENAMSGTRNLFPMMNVDLSPSNVSYSMDDLSDDEDLSGGVDAPPPNGQHVMSPTTASAFAHLMQQAMLASRAQPQPQLQQQPQQQQSTSQSDSANNARITFEMLRQALQLTQPSTSTNPPRNDPSPIQPPVRTEISSSTPLSDSNTPRPDMSAQLQQMRDLGITDENVCLQALYATNGDVQAAIDLIFSASHS